MMYWGIEYTITQTQPNVWKWRVMVGNPEMLRMGEATDQMHAELQVRHVIDRSLKVQERLESRTQRTSKAEGEDGDQGKAS